MANVLDTRGVHLVAQIVRGLLAAALWCVVLVYFALAMGRFTRIFTGDESYGALDGFQFVDAMYGATWRLLLAIVAGLGVWRVLRWDPGGRRAAAVAARPAAAGPRAFAPSELRVCPLLESLGVEVSAPDMQMRTCPLLDARGSVPLAA